MADESSVRVAVRIRPQTPGEVVEGCGVCARAGGAAGAGGVALGTERAFTFDFAFEPTGDQEQVYDTCVRKLVDAALEGYNATVLAYGQTGSGKTYTMGSGWEDAAEGAARRGIIPRAIRDLFAGADARADEARARGQLPPEFSVHAQFIELYNEDIVDLLDPARDAYAKGGLRIAEDGCGGVRIVGASCKPVRGAADALGVLRAGALARTTAATNMNSSSSRSHAVFTLMMRQRRLADEEEGGGVEKEEAEPEQYETLTAKFHFVDLAGSERLKRTGATGERAREGISINCGLLALGNVISALGDRARRAAHVPYRDSKLTRLLQDSLGGNSNTVMIACISPSDRDFMETLNTLKYANRARNIKNRCFVNQDLSSRTIGALRREIERLQGELADYKQGKRTAENGAEGWSDVAQENAILTAELDTLRRRCKALQATVDQLASKNAQLLAARALGACAEGGGGEGDEPREGGDAECALTTLVQGYASEIEDLRAQLLAANALYEGDARRRRARADSHDAAGVLEDAKRELEKERRLLARSMQDDIGERERAEGESDSEPDAEPAPDMTLSAELAALSSDIDTKQRLIEELELSQRRLDALKTHYETRLDTLHHQIRATQDERDKVLASYANQPSPQPEKTSAIRAEYTARLGEMSRELRRLNAAAREHARLQAAHAQQALAVRAARDELAGMKRDKVKLVQRMRADARRHAAAEAARAREVAQLRKQGRRHAHLIRSLEADKLLKEQVLRRKQEEVSLLRRGHRDKLSPRAAGRVNGNDRTHAHLWSRISPWLSRTAAARAELAAQEAGLERCLRRRRAASPAARARLQAEIDDAQASIMQLAEETDESEVSALLAGAWSAEAARHALAQLLAHALTSAGEAAAAQRRLRDATERIRELEQAAHASPPLSFSPGGGDGGGGVDGGGGGGGLSEWSAAVLAAIPSGTCTRPVSPTLDFSAVEPRPVPEGVREFAAHATAPASPARDPPPFQRNTGRRGSVRLRDLGVVSRDASPDCMTQSLLEPPAAAPAPLARVPSAPGGLSEASPPSPGAARRLRDVDVFLRLAGAAGGDAPPRGRVREFNSKRSPGAAGAWSLQCTHVAEGHVGAALALAATAHALYSGGVDRTVRAWDVAAGAEGWRGACAGAVGALAAGPALPVLLAAAGACVRVFDTRASQPVHTLWSSGAVGAAPPARAGGETAVSALAVRRHLLYTAAGDRLRLWDLRKLECITKVYTGHAAAVMCLAVGGAGAGAGADLLCTGSKDHYVRTLELNQETREAARRVLHPPHYDGVQALALLEGGALYSASRDSSIKRWDLHSGALTHGVMSAHAGWVSGLAACGAGGAGGGGGGAALASSGRDGRLRLWSAALGAAASARAPDALHAVAAGDGLLYTAGNGGEVRVWRVDDGAASCSP